MHAERHISHCSARSRQNQLFGDQRIEGVPGRDRLKIRPPSNPTISVRMQDRSFCHQFDSSIEAIHQLETRSRSTQLDCDALIMNWRGLGGYAFPPFNLVPAVLNKVLTDQTDIVLVAPVWQGQTWWPLLQSLLTQERFFCPADHTFCRIQQIRNRYTQCINATTWAYFLPPPML